MAPSVSWKADRTINDIVQGLNGFHISIDELDIRDPSLSGLEK